MEARDLGGVFGGNVSSLFRVSKRLVGDGVNIRSTVGFFVSICSHSCQSGGIPQLLRFPPRQSLFEGQMQNMNQKE